MAYFYDDLEDASRKLEEIIAQFNDKPVFFNFERRIRAIVEHMRKQDQWLAKRKEAAKLIDPSIAEITSDIAQLVDPYELIEEVPPEADCVGRVYFVRNPGSDIWVWDGDLPEAIRTALWERLKSNGARPEVKESDHDVPF
jgi:hypothetical protein